MDEPIYSQVEADALIAMSKAAAYEGQIYVITARVTEGFAASEFSATADNGPDDVRFKIVTQSNFDLHAYSLTLLATMGGRPFQALVRYDVHDSLHPNSSPCCPPPDEIEPGVFHVHRYNECAINQGLRWDKCALPLNVAQDDDLRRQLRQLIGLFITDMKITFSDSETIQSLFDTGKP